MALATGRSETTGRLPVGAAVDRAARLAALRGRDRELRSIETQSTTREVIARCTGRG
jgi:hypothetical protein